MGKLTQSGVRYWTDLSERAAEWPSSYLTESTREGKCAEENEVNAIHFLQSP